MPVFTRGIAGPDISPSGVGEQNVGANVGGGAGVYRDKSGVTLNLRSLIGGTGITVTQNANDIDIALTNPIGEANDGANVGAGTGNVFRDKTGVDLNLKTLIGGTNVNIVDGADDITFNVPSAAPSGVASGMLSGTYPGPDVINFTLSGEATGDITFHNAGQWDVLAAGTAGQILTTQGAGSAPTWETIVPGEINVAANVGVSPGEVFRDKTGSTLNFRTIGSGSNVTVETIGNSIQISVASAPPNGAAGGDLDGIYPDPDVVDLTMTGEVQGAILYFNGANWVVLGPGTAGYGLITQGGAADPVWGFVGDIEGGANLGTGTGDLYAGKLGAALEFRSLEGLGNITIETVGDNVTIDGSDLIGRGESAGGDLGGTYPDPTVTDLTITDEEQGSIIYFDGLNWVHLAPGDADDILKSGGTGADPYWSDIGADGEINEGVNVGTGVQWYRNKTGVYLNFRTALAGTNVAITNLGDELRFDVAGAEPIGAAGGELTGTYPDPDLANLYFDNSIRNAFGGVNAGQRATTTGVDNAAWGDGALGALIDGIQNFAGGSRALESLVSGSNSTAGGFRALGASTQGNNTAFGSLAGANLILGTRNTFLGEAGSALTQGSDNFLAGFAAGSNLTQGDRNIVIGSSLLVPNATGDDQLVIGSLTGLIYGNLSTGLIAIGGTTIPTGSAELALRSTDKGFVFNRLTTIQRDAISVPVDGMHIYNTDANRLEYYDGIIWQPIAGSGAGETNTASSAGSGITIFYQKSGVDLQFNAVKSENDRITVALDGVSHDVELTLNEANIIHQNLSGAGTNTHSQIDTHIGVAVTSSAVISDLFIVIGDGGSRGVQGSLASVDGVGNINTPGFLRGAYLWAVDTTNPYVYFEESGAAVDEKRYSMGVFGGDFFMNIVSDDHLTSIPFMTVARTAMNVTGITLHDPLTVQGALDMSANNIANVGTVDGVDVSAHDHSGAGQGGTIDHTSLSSIGSNSHATIDTHIANNAIHFTEASIDHTAISNIGVNAHSVIDTHLASTSNPHSVTAAQVPIDEIGTATYDDVQDFVKTVGSAGALGDSYISDAGGATIDVAAGTGYIRTTDSHTGTLQTFDWSASNGISIPSNTVRYVGVEYNAGSPQVVVKTSDTWDENTDFPLGSVVNEAGTLHVLNNPKIVGDAAGRILHRIYETQPFKRADRLGGLILGETGTRNITLTEGEIYDRTNEFDITEKNTSVADTFDRYYRDGAGGFTKQSAQTQWNNTQYDDGSGTLQTLTTNRWAVQWFYVEMDDSIVSMFGFGGNYVSQAGAEAEAAPSSLPDRLLTHGKLIGRIVFQEGDSTGIVESVFTTTFGTAGVTEHNNLASLQGGTAGQYYHLTSAQHTDLTDAGDSTLHYHATDRARANHTGTQTRSTISDFAHASTHENGGGADEINVGGLSGELADKQKVAVEEGGTLRGTRSTLNFIEGTNISLTITDNDPDVDITIAAAGSVGEANTASSAGTGVSLYYQKTGIDLEFNAIKSENNRLSVSLDGVSHDIELTVNEANIVHQNLSGAGTNTHATIDTHIASTTNPHSTSIANIGGGTLAELNAAISDTNVPPETRTLTAGTGLSGGGDLSANRTFNLEDTAVTPGSYTSADITVDAQGRITAAANGSGGSGEANTASSAGTGTSLFYQKNGVDLEFNAVKSENDRLSVSLDGVTHDIELTVNEGNIVHDNLSGAGSNTHAQIDTHIADSTIHFTEASIDHGSIGGLADDDHTQYHNNTRGDARYYQQSEFINISAGAGDAGKPIVLDAAGHIDSTMINDGDIDHTAIANIGTNSHATIDTHIADSTIHFTEASIDHGSIAGLADDDHTQYHNNTRGDARYYQQSEFINSSAGAGDAGKPIVLDVAGHVDATMVNDGDIDHTAIANIGTNSHATIDTHIADSTIHFTEASIDHTAIANIGTNSHATIDTHLASTANPHSTSIANIGSGTLAQLNSAVSDATLDDSSSSRTPTSHASSHQNGGGDEISVAGLSGELADKQKVAVEKSGALQGTRSTLNFIEGANVTLTITDNDPDVDITIATSGSVGEANTASSAGTGTSLFYQKTAVDLEFNAIKSENDRLSISLDGVSHDIELTVNEGNIVHDNLSGAGSNTHAQIDTHIADSTIHFTEASIDHGSIGGLADDDHTQYHNNTRGDARYYQQSEFINSSAGVGDAGKPIVLDAAGHVDATMVNDSDIDHTLIANIGTNSHATIDTHLASTSNPHSTSIANINSGTLAQLNSALSDATLDDSSSSRTPTSHASSHQNGGGDEISVAGLSGELADAQPVAVSKNSGATVGTRSTLNFIEGSNITLTIADDAGGDEVDITIAASGSVGEANTASSAGTGTSLYYQKTGVDLEFNAIKSENNRLSVSLDGVSHDIELTVNEGNIVHQNLSGAGTNTHTEIDTHIADGTIHFTEASIDHANLSNLQGGTTAEYYHLTSAQHTDLTDAGDSTLHYHATDRARANHTGTQAESTIVFNDSTGHDHSGTGNNGTKIDYTDLDNIPSTFTPSTHSTSHENGGGDEISVAGLSGELADAQPVAVSKNSGVTVGTRSTLNFIEGSNVTLTIVDDAGGDEVDITIASTAGESNTASSAGTGTSLYYQKTGVDLEFNAIKSENNRLTVSLDGVSHDIELTVNEGNIVHQNLSGAGTNTHTEIDTHIADTTIHFTEASIDHANLSNLQGGTTAEYYHLTSAQHTDLTDSGDSTLHYHATDRARANHTGTQAESTVVFNDTTGHNHSGTGNNGTTIDYGDLSNIPSTFTPSAHNTSHQNGGSDEISVAGLSGLLADGQTPLTHASSHQNGGGDEISVAGLSGELADAQPVAISKNSGATVGTRSTLNFIEGSNITLTIADDAGGNEVDITIASTGGSGEVNTASSAGTGVSLYYQKTGVDLEFNAIKSENNRLSISLDGVSHDIELTVNEGNIVHQNLSGAGTNTHTEIDTHIADTTIHFTEASIDHADISNLQGGTTDEYYHFTAAQHTDLTDAGDSTLHYHATDRARANHTGTQTRSTISDFAHDSTHENGGADEISVAGLSGELADAQPVAVSKNSGATVGTRSTLNFIEGSNVTLTIADDAGGDEVDITIASTGGAGATQRQESVTTQAISGSDTALTDTLNNTPTSNASVRLFLNGVLQEQGTGKDYTISGSTITWLASTGTAVDMDTSDVLIAVYDS